MAKKKAATTDYETIKDWLKRHPQRVRMQRAFDALCRLFQQEDKQDLGWWHSVGRHALILYPIDDQRFGQNFTQKLANGLPIPKDRPESKLPTSYAQDRVNTLWSARKFTHRFSKKKLQDLGRTLTVHHIMGLLTVDKEKNHKSLDSSLRNVLPMAGVRAYCGGKSRTREALRAVPVDDAKPKTTVTAAIAVGDFTLLARRAGWLAMNNVWKDTNHR